MAKGKEITTTIVLEGSVAESLKKAFAEAEGMGQKTEKSLESSFSKIGGFAASAAKAVGAGFVAAGTAAVAFGASSVKVGAEFDSSMSQVAATMGKTMEEMNSITGEVDTSFGHFSGTLRDFAQYMGSNTAFSATEAAEALNYMALAGYDAQTSMTMLPNVLNLASAGAMDLASASDMVTDTQSALGLSLEETTELVDKMAQASSKSNTSVSQLGEAMLTIGGTAKNLAGGTTELSQALGLLADNGIKGAEGGTALRNILLNLTPKSEAAAAAMESIGLNAYDAEGKMRPLKDVFADLNNGLEGMTDEEKTGILSNIFNKVDLKSVNALLATSTDRWDELSEAIENSEGAAAQMAATQLDNLEGDVTLFKSALEGVQIAVSDMITPTLREIVQFGSGALGSITEGLKSGGIEGAGEVIKTLLMDGFKSAMEGIKTELPGMLTSTLTSVFGMSEPDASSLVSQGSEAVQDFIEGIKSGIASVKPVFEGLWNTITGTFEPIIHGLIPVANGLMQMFFLKFQLIGSAITRFSPYISNIVNSVMPAFVAAGQSIGAVLGTIGTVMTENIIPGFQTFADAAMGAWEKVLAALTPVIDRISQFITAILPVLTPFVQSTYTMLGALFQNVLVPIGSWLMDTLGTAVSGIVTLIGNSINMILDFIQPILPGIIETFTGIMDFLTGVFTGDWEAAWQGIEKIFTGIWDTMKGVVKGVINTIIDAINGVINGINGVAGAIGDAVGVKIKIPTIPKLAFAEGGTVTSPTVALVGEGGEPETIIPHNNSARSRSLLNEAARGVLGSGATVSAGGSDNRTYNITFAPVIEGAGLTDKALQDAFEEFKRNVTAYLDERDREAFA